MITMAKNTLVQLLREYEYDLSPSQDDGRIEIVLSSGRQLVLTPTAGGYNVDLIDEPEPIFNEPLLYVAGQPRECPICHEEVRPGEACQTLLCMLTHNAKRRRHPRQQGPSFNHLTTLPIISGLTHPDEGELLNELVS